MVKTGFWTSNFPQNRGHKLMFDGRGDQGRQCRSGCSMPLNIVRDSLVDQVVRCSMIESFNVVQCRDHCQMRMSEDRGTRRQAAQIIQEPFSVFGEFRSFNTFLACRHPIPALYFFRCFFLVFSVQKTFIIDVFHLVHLIGRCTFIM